MSQRLFSHNQNGCQAIAPWQPYDERQLQRFFEANLPALLGVGFVISEWSPASEPFRMDTLGIDFEGHPVIIEFKKGLDASLIAQVLSYQNCLKRHTAAFEALVRERYGSQVKIDWSVVRLICVASDFSPYDTEALDSVKADIDLVRYQFFGRENVMVDTVKTTRQPKKTVSSAPRKRPFSQQLQIASDSVKHLLASLRAHLSSIDDLFESESASGLVFTARGAEVAMISLTQGLQPRLKISLQADLDEETASGFSSVRRGKGSSEITLRQDCEIPYLVKWIEKEAAAATIAF